MAIRIREFLLLLCLLLLHGQISGQKTGLVLSGGGAAGLAHLGVIKALEEHEIPIDYITGTSMGALIGGFYAAGYSVDEIISFLKDEQFLLALSGDLPKKDIYYFTKEPEDASMIRLKLSPEKLLSTSIPANLVTPDLMEYLLMTLLEPPSAAAQYNFDELMIPFRCVAADITSKEEVIFDQGSLALALRASSTYPFYFTPVSADSTLLFDGGLYNNFPADVMYDSFLPDAIIGSNVASEIEPPIEGDLLSQVRNMIMRQSDFTIKCDYGLIIEPKSETGVFDFSDIDYEVNIGYQATLARIEEIRAITGDRSRSIEELYQMRKAFHQKLPKPEIGEIKITGRLTEPQKAYVASTLGPSRKDSTFSFEDFRPQFLRTTQDGKIKYALPKPRFNQSTSKFDTDLFVIPEKDFTLYFGGNVSSRPINVGYAGVRYNLFGRTSASLFGNIYFGKFYGSLHIEAAIDVGGKKRWEIVPHFTQNRIDYFRSFATFFEPSRPSFIVKNETFGGLTFNSSLGNNSVFRADVKYGETLDRYYQTEIFTVEDTADYTQFTLFTGAIGIDRNTLNRKLYASEGSRSQISIRGVIGDELTRFGTTSADIEDFRNEHSWVEARFGYEAYLDKLAFVTFGIQADVVYSTKPFYENFTASLISAPAYQPIPESRTIFLDEFRANTYAGLGVKAIFEVRKNIEIRAEGYGFQGYREILRNDLNEAEFSDQPGDPLFIGAGALVWHSPLGPVSLNLNYYDSREDSPWSFFFNFGYLLFNKSVYEL
jgi:NTE family protein